MSVITQYAYGISEATNDILKQMAEEDHVSMTTELENAISGWYRFRHGYTGLGTLGSYIDELKENNRRGSIQLSINEEMETIRKLIDGSIREQQEGMKDAWHMGR